jgi:DNA-binding transcriptional regulator LsrR (DeoR family)
MRKKMPPTPEKRRDIIDVAKAYYVDDISKVEIAKKYGISRFQVAAMLDRARELGYVQININADQVDKGLSKTLIEVLGLDNVVVIDAIGDDIEQRDAVGLEAGKLLLDGLSENDVIGVAWGRTTAAMVRSLKQLPPVDVVQLTGVVGNDLTSSPVEVVRTASILSGGTAYPLFEPFFIDNSKTASEFRKQEQIASILAKYPKVSVAVVSIGSFRPAISQVLDALPVKVRTPLLKSDAAAEICSIPISDEGLVLDGGYLSHLIGINPTQLKNIPRVIAVASGAAKAPAVIAAAKSKIINELVIDSLLAQRMVSLLKNESSANEKRKGQ